MPTINHLKKIHEQSIFLILGNFKLFLLPCLEPAFSFHSYPRRVVLNRRGEVASLRVVVKILPMRGHFDCDNWNRECYWHLVDTRDVFKHPTNLKTSPNNKELSDPKCQ